MAIAHDLREQERPTRGWLSSAAFESVVIGSIERPAERVHGMEPAGEARRRFSAAVARLICENPEGNLILVSHGTVISLVAAPLFATTASELWRRLGPSAYLALTLPGLAPAAIMWSIGADAIDAPTGAP